MRTFFFVAAVVLVATFSFAFSAAVSFEEKELVEDRNLQGNIPLGVSSDWWCNANARSCNNGVNTAVNPLPPCSYTKASPQVYKARASGDKTYATITTFMVLQDDQFGSLRSGVVKDLLDRTGVAQTAINWFVRTVIFDVITSSLRTYSAVSFPDCGYTQENLRIALNDRITFSYNAQLRQLRLDFETKVLMDAITPATSPSVVSRSGPTITTAAQVQSLLLQPGLSTMARLSSILFNRASAGVSAASLFVNAVGPGSYRAPSSYVERVVDAVQRALLLKTGSKAKPVAGGTTGKAKLVIGH